MMEARVCCFLVLKKQLFYGIGLGPREYADRILDACSTYILHTCSDPFPVSKRAGKRWKLETTYTEDAEGNSRPHHRLPYDWRVPETAVMQQDEGQAFWIYKGRAQQVQTAQVPITQAQVNEGWSEIRRREAMQRIMLAHQAQQRQQRQNQTQPIQPTPSPQPTRPPISKPSPLLLAANEPPKQGQGPTQPPKSAPKTPAPAVPPSPPQPPIPPVPAVDDDEPDEL